MNHDVIITCALTGAGDTSGRSPLVPVTPKQIAEAAWKRPRPEPQWCIAMYVIQRPDSSAAM